MEYNFVAVGAGSSISTSAEDPRDIHVSEDGLNWQTIKRNPGQIINSSSGEELPLYTISYANGYWFSVSSFNRPKTFWRSLDLINWFPCTTPSGGIVQPRIGAENTEVFYAFNKYWTSVGNIDGPYVSDDGLTWSIFDTGGIDTMAEAPGILAIANQNAFKFTNDGINFTGKGIPFTAGGSVGRTYLSYSTNGFFTALRSYDNINGEGLEAATTYDFGDTWTFTDITSIIFDVTYMPKHNSFSDGTLFWKGEKSDGTGVLVTTADGTTFNEVASPIPATEPTAYTSTIANGPLGNGPEVILISNAYGLAYGNSSIDQGNPWTLLDLGIDPDDDTTLIRHISNKYPTPVSLLSYIEVGANNPVYTVSQDSLIQATLRYEAPIETGQNNLTLYKVYKDYRYSKTGEAFPAMPKTDEGLPFYEDIYDPDDPNQTLFSTQPGVLPYRYEQVEPWGKIAIFINGQDVSFFRDAATIIEAISWQTLGNFEAASLYFPMISQYDKLAETTPTTSSGTGGGVLPDAIPWLTDKGGIEIKRIKPDDTLETIWLGTINGFDLDPSGIGMRITANGLLYEANHQLLPGQYVNPTVITPKDTGLLAAEILNSIDGQWSYAEPLETGISTIKTPSWEDALGFLRNLNAIGSPKIWIDTDYKPYVTGRPDLDPERKDNAFDIIAGQDGIDLSLQYDSTANPTVIYGTGRTTTGVEWRNVVYPASPSPGRDYPFDNPEQTIKKGMGPWDTLSFVAIGNLWLRLAEKGFLPQTQGFRLYFTDELEAAVKAAQEAYGFDITGEVDINLWSRLNDIADISEGAYIAPLYISPLVDPSSPSYDPSVRRVEQFIDFGSNLTAEDGKDVAEKIVLRDMIQYNSSGTPIYKQRKSVTGNITMTMDPVEYIDGEPVSRWDLKPGDSIRVIPHIFSSIQDDKHDAESGTRWEAGDSGGSVVLYIQKIEWSFTDTPKATLTVSTRDLEFSELDAAQARVKVSNAERAINQKAKKASGKTAGS